MSSRVRWTESDARAFLSRWRRSGQSLAAYCASQGILYERARRWRSQLLAETTALDLRPVRVSSEDSAALSGNAGGGDLEVLLRSGHTLRIRPDFDVSTVRTLVEILEAL